MESFLALCYSPNITIAAYSLGVATHVVMETAEGGSSESEKGREDVEEIGSMVVESLLIMDHSSSNEAPFRVILASFSPFNWSML